ncbi:MAG: glycosyltransferase [Candidatus Micrarchaeota archaeon]|nr:glycosyltransferase [Candidatus Micrarchaeota archaeon]
MKVALLGMVGEYDKEAASLSGINKYMYSIYSEIKKIGGLEIDKIEYKKVAKKFPWANHLAFYLQSGKVGNKAYDIIHNPNGIRPCRIKSNGRTKFVTTIHDLMPVTDRSRPFHGLKGGLVSLNSRFSDYVATEGFKLALKSDHIIVDAELGKSELVEFAKEHGGYDPEKITAIRLAIDEKFNSPVPPKKKNKIFKVGYVGSYNGTKNINMAITSIKLIEDKEVSLELWGKKTVEAQLLDALIGGDKRIQFKGIAPEEQKVGIFDSFDVFVHPGVYESIIQFEALARGLPVIVRKDAKLTEDLRAHCFEVEDEQQMAECIMRLKSQGYEERKRKEGIEWARGFTWKRNAEDVVKVYKKVLE